MPTLTLFGGVIETKQEARDRAAAIAECLAIIETAPDERRCIAAQWHTAMYYISRARAHKLDPNDLDGLQRDFGDLSGALTAKECHAMNQNRSLWRRFTGEFAGWAGALPTSFYCVTLHPKEIQVLDDFRQECLDRLVILREDVREAKRRLLELRAVDADLPADIAKRYNLTPKGERLARPDR